MRPEGEFILLGAIIIILTLVLAAAVFFVVPPAEGLGYLVRIIYFHVPMAWVSVLAFLGSAWWAVRFLRSADMLQARKSYLSAQWGLIFALLATVSGAVFAKLTWGAFWNWDPRQTTIFVLLLIYGAYLTLHAAIEEPERRARVCAVYAIMAFLTVPFLVFILPRLYFSLHPSPIVNGTGLAMEPVMLIVLLAAMADATLMYIWLLQRGLRSGKGREHV